MKNLLKQLIGGVTFFSGASWLLRLWFGRKANRAVILMYHRVVENANPLNRDVESCSPKMFEKQMAYLSKHYNVISFDEFAESETLPPKTVVLTFDDGYGDNYHNAFPILKKYNLPATVFLSTGNMDNEELFWWDKVALAINSMKDETLGIPGFGVLQLNNKPKAICTLCEYLKTIPHAKKERIISDLLGMVEAEPDKQNLFLDWDQVREMQKARVSFGAHTCSHPILTQMPEDEAIGEITKSKQRIEEEIGQPVKFFAYPNGTTKDMSDSLNNTLQELGIQHAVSTEHGVVQDKSFVLKRMGVDRSDNMHMFRIKLFGLF